MPTFTFNAESFPTMPFNPFVQLQPRVAPRNNGQCTHLTMTRLYTHEFRCVVCMQLPRAGWLYRCTQDRELMLEDEFDRGEAHSKLDTLCNIWERASTPRKRGPAARASVTSFLDETSDEGIKTYSDEQLNLIFEQRAHALDLAIQTSQNATPEENSIFSRFAFDNSSLSESGESSAARSDTTSTKVLKKPWVPAKGTECQFKCCARCRPTLADRAFLSLEGIVNNDLPLTAITGFGFHLRKSRPVGLIKHVKNIGLRPSPPPRPRSSLPRTRSYKPECGMGLGLLKLNTLPLLPRPLPEPPTSSTASDSSTMPSDFDIADYYSSEASLPQEESVPLPVPEQSSELATEERQLRSSIRSITNEAPKKKKRVSFESEEPSIQPEMSSSSSLPNSQNQSQLPPGTANISMADFNDFVDIAFKGGMTNEALYRGLARITPLPPPTPTEAASLMFEAPLTDMEEGEAEEGEFGAEPLEVRDGIAVTEEAVGLHVADLITQV